MDINIGINEKIVTGRKFRRLIDKDSKLWQLISWWTKARDVEFDDGKTAEQKLGNINGITSDFSVDDESTAASSSLTNRAYERFNEFTDDGKIHRIFIGEDGKPYIEYKDGADTVLKKLGEVDEKELMDSVSNSFTNEFTKGTWLYCVSYGTIAVGDITVNPNFSLAMLENKCDISDPDVNFIKKIFVKQSVEKTTETIGGGNHRAYCGLFIYIVTVNTETATIDVSYSPNTGNHFGIINNKCKIKIAD